MIYKLIICNLINCENQLYICLAIKLWDQLLLIFLWTKQKYANWEFYELLNNIVILIFIYIVFLSATT